MPGSGMGHSEKYRKTLNWFGFGSRSLIRAELAFQPKENSGLKKTVDSSWALPEWQCLI